MIGDFGSAVHSNIMETLREQFVGHTQACTEASGASLYLLKKASQHVITISFTKALGK